MGAGVFFGVHGGDRMGVGGQRGVDSEGGGWCRWIAIASAQYVVTSGCSEFVERLRLARLPHADVAVHCCWTERFNHFARVLPE